LSEKQRKFVGAELARKRMGKKTHRPVTYRDRDYVSKRVIFETKGAPRWNIWGLRDEVTQMKKTIEGGFTSSVAFLAGGCV
jgi:hypothetical protein